MISVVARPILVLGSKFTMSEHYSCLDFGPSMLKCNLGEIFPGQHSVFCSECWVKFLSSGQSRPAPPNGIAHRHSPLWLRWWWSLLEKEQLLMFCVYLNNLSYLVSYVILSFVDSLVQFPLSLLHHWVAWPGKQRDVTVNLVVFKIRMSWEFHNHYQAKLILCWMKPPFSYFHSLLLLVFLLHVAMFKHI